MSKWSKIYLCSLRRKCSTKNLVFSDIYHLWPYSQTLLRTSALLIVTCAVYIYFWIMTRLKSVYDLDLIEIGVSALETSKLSVHMLPNSSTVIDSSHYLSVRAKHQNVALHVDSWRLRSAIGILFSDVSTGWAKKKWTIFKSA